MTTQLNRPEPLMPVQNYQTYGASMPLATHWVQATCEEIDCEPYLHGWSINAVVLDERDKAAIKEAGYRYIVLPVSENEEQWLFEPGQPCFKSRTHRREIGRPPVFYRRPGDWRGNPTGTRPFVHSSPESWVDDFSTHLDRLRAEIEKG